MPLGLLIRDTLGFEAFANGDGPPLGRELEVAVVVAGIEAEEGAQRGVVDGGCALLRVALLQSGPGPVHGVRRVLGVRERTVACGDIRAG